MTSDPKLLELQQILNVDSNFSSYRPHLKLHDDEETLYVKWRKYLLFKQFQNNKILYNVIGDRRTDYLYFREILLSSKFPLRNRTRKIQEGFVIFKEKINKKNL